MLLDSTTMLASTASGGILGLDLETFIIQLVTFILAMLVLQRFAVKPILKKLEERRNTIEQGVSLGEQMQKEKAALSKRNEEIVARARAEADKIIADAQAAGRESIQAAEEDARTKADAILKRADEQLKQDVARARRNLEKEMAELVSEATEAIIDEKVDTKKDAALIERALKGAGKA